MDVITYMLKMMNTVADQTALLYFFSTLAQCAAAFAALIGVFAVFRLQSNPSVIIQKYEDANLWLTREANFSSVGAINSTNFELFRTVKRSLGLIIDGTQRRSEQVLDEAKRYLARINDSEQFPGQLVYKTAVPLKWWTGIFFSSLIIIPFSSKVAGVLGLIICIIFSWAVFRALLKTKDIIQECLALK